MDKSKPLFKLVEAFQPDGLLSYGDDGVPIKATSTKNVIVCRYDEVLAGLDGYNMFDVRGYDLHMLQFLAAAERRGYNVALFADDPDRANDSLKGAVKHLTWSKLLPKGTQFPEIKELKAHYGVEPFMIIDKEGAEHLLRVMHQTGPSANDCEEVLESLNVFAPNDSFIKMLMKDFQEKEQGLGVNVASPSGPRILS